MVPACYPSKISSTTGLREAVVFALPSVTGLVRWTDYIPVKLVASADAALEGRTDAGGFIPMDMLSSNAGLMGWVDYLPVYVDNSATDAWAITATGFIPYAASGGGAAIPDFYLNLSSPTNVTLGTTQARGSLLVSGAVISQSAVPSRISGVAPLYVNIDATGTTSTLSTNAAHELYFATDFGDPSAGTWTNGVQSAGLTSKNLGIGPVTGHVYETPGTYTVTTVITDGVNTEERTNTITVTDPNTVYAGTNTICISHSGNFTGAPSGATQITAGSTDMYAAWNTHKASNKRILFCKADSWTASATVSLDGYTGVFFGGYGTGVAHSFASGTLALVTPDTGITNLFQGGGSTDCKICNFKVMADATHYVVSTYTAESVAFTVYKIEIRGATGGIESTTGGNDAAFCKHDQHCVYECSVDEVYGYAGLSTDTPRYLGATWTAGSPGVFTAIGHNFKRFNKVQLEGTIPAGLSFWPAGTYYISSVGLTANTFTLSSTFGTETPVVLSDTGSCEVRLQPLGGGVGAFITMARGGFMGNYLDNCNHGEQTVRIPYINTSHINNNTLKRPNQGKNILKVHCRGYDHISSVSSGYSEKMVIASNVMDLRGGYSYGDAIPNNGQIANGVGTSDIIIGNGGPSPGGERCRNAIVEHNFTYACLGYSKDSYGMCGVGGPNMTVRNNIADFSIGDRTTATPGNYSYTGMYFGSVSSTNTQEQTVGVRFYNNTCYSNLSDSETADFINIGLTAGGYANVDDVKIQNNLWYYPHAITSSKAAYKLTGGASPTNLVSTYNTDTVAGGGTNTTPNFVATPPVALTDWRPNTGSYAINAGASVPVLRDFNMATRVGGTYDLGAVLP